MSTDNTILYVTEQMFIHNGHFIQLLCHWDDSGNVTHVFPRISADVVFGRNSTSSHFALFSSFCVISCGMHFSLSLSLHLCLWRYSHDTICHHEVDITTGIMLVSLGLGMVLLIWYLL
jgi:hypothetical protein